MPEASMLYGHRPLVNRDRLTNRAENPTSAFGKHSQRLVIANGDATPIDLNQSVLLQSRQRPRHDFAHRAYAGGYLLVGQNQRHFDAGVSVAPARPRFSHQPSRQPLIDLAQ